jgi:GNAT superfamily N-acetyltransferase
MADAKIDIVGPGELSTIVDLYNQVFKPARRVDFFERRFLGRYNLLTLVATIDRRPVGFYIGFELKPTVFFSWLWGVLPDYRRAGIASQLMEAAEAWSLDHGYEHIRFESHNNQRAMLHMAIDHNYDITGLRWDPDHATNLVIFEKTFER